MYNNKSSYVEGQGVEVQQPIQLTGWLIKQDGENLYLADEENGPITFYVKNELVAYVEQIVHQDEYDLKLDSYKEGIDN